MKTFRFAVLGITLLLAVVACDRNRDRDMRGSSSSADACPHCAGVQTLRADGTCPKCGMQMADACPHCPGVQTLRTDGTCPKCGMKMR